MRSPNCDNSKLLWRSQTSGAVTAVTKQSESERPPKKNSRSMHELDPRLSTLEILKASKPTKSFSRGGPFLLAAAPFYDKQCVNIDATGPALPEAFQALLVGQWARLKPISIYLFSLCGMRRLNGL